MTNLSDLLPAGAASKQLSFTASGAISSGQTVILQSDGTVKAVEATAAGLGSAAVYESGSTDYSTVVYDSYNNKLVVFYQDASDSNKGKAAVGTVTGNSISWGTPVQFSTGNDVTYIGGTYDPDTYKVIVVYRDGANSNYGTANVGTVSGTSISFGSAVVYESAAVFWNAATYDTSADKVVVAYRDAGDSNKGKAIVGTVSGTSISFGSAAEIDGGESNRIGITFDTTNNRVIIAYQGTGIELISGAVSGTSISFGSSTQLEASGTGYAIGIAYNSTDDNFLVAWGDGGSSYLLTLRAGQVSGSGFSLGSNVNVSGVNVYYPRLAYDSSANTYNLAYADSADSNKGKVAPVTVSGTTPSFGTAVVFDSASTEEIGAAYNSSAKNTVIVYKDGGNSNYGTGIIWANAGSNSSSFLGIADAAISNAASGKITMKGGIAANGLSGLTPNAIYYVQDDGTLNTATSAVNYDIANGSYTQAFSVSSQDTFPSGVAFNPAGTKMFVVGNTGDDVNEYTLSTGFDVSTASFVDSFSVSGQQAAPMSVAFNTDGTKMYIVGETEDTVAQYALSAGFDVSSASYTQAFDISGQETEAQGITFNTDGSKMFIVGDTGNDINEYTLSTGFDVSTASFVDSFSLASQTTQPKEGVFNTDGTELYVLARDNQKVYKYTLSTGFDVSTASYASVEFSVSSQETSPQGLAFSADGSKMYVCGDTGDDVNQYATTSTATNSTTVEAGKAMSATSINLDYST